MGYVLCVRVVQLLIHSFQHVSVRQDSIKIILVFANKIFNKLSAANQVSTLISLGAVNLVNFVVLNAQMHFLVQDVLHFIGQ